MLVYNSHITTYKELQMSQFDAIKALAGLMTARIGGKHDEDEQIPQGRFRNPAKMMSPTAGIRRRDARIRAKKARRRNRWAKS